VPTIVGTATIGAGVSCKKRDSGIENELKLLRREAMVADVCGFKRDKAVMMHPTTDWQMIPNGLEALINRQHFSIRPIYNFMNDLSDFVITKFERKLRSNRMKWEMKSRELMRGRDGSGWHSKKRASTQPRLYQRDQLALGNFRCPFPSVPHRRVLRVCHPHWSTSIPAASEESRLSSSNAIGLPPDSVQFKLRHANWGRGQLWITHKMNVCTVGARSWWTGMMIDYLHRNESQN
jgi:hypothetical protein